MLNYGIETMKLKLKQTLANHERKRVTRGAINFFGSLIKAVTGNLDQEDAKRYDDVIQSIIRNQNKIKEAANKQVTLVLKSIEMFNNTVKIIQDNQLLLEERMNKLELEVIAYMANKTSVYVIYNQLIILTTMVNEVLDTVTNALTFAKQGIFHPSIIKPEELLNELETLQLPTKLELPIEAKVQNLYSIESILRVKAYIKKNEITFIIQIPLMESDPYNYYQLYPLPLRINHTKFSYIKPNTRNLAINERKYVNSNKGCMEIGYEEFMCEYQESQLISRHSPCEVQLLTFSNDYSNCEHNVINYEHSEIIKLPKNQWLVIAPSEIKIVKECGNSKEYEIIKGTYLIQITQNCIAKVENKLLKIFEPVNKKTRIAKLPRIKVNIKPEKEIIIQNKVTNAQLNNLTMLHTKLKALKTDLQNITEVKFHERPITIWTVLMIIMLAGIGIVLLYTYVRKRMKKRNETTHNTGTEMDTHGNHPLSVNIRG